MIKLKDLLNEWYKQDSGPKRWSNDKGLTEFEQSLELGKVYTDKDMNPFKVNEGDELQRWKVYIKGEKEPLILTGKDQNSVKKFAHKMISNNSVKIQKVVKEGKLNEAGSIGGALNLSDMESSYIAPSRDTSVKNQGVFLQKFSSKEARSIIDGALKNYVKDLRNVQGRVVKDWMSAAKSGTIDFFDIIRGLKTGDVRRAHQYETDFLVSLLTKDKIIDRFRSYFKGKKGKKR